MVGEPTLGASDALWILPTQAEEDARGRPTILGEIRANPYAHANMMLAYRELLGDELPALPVTHRYVKFSPRTFGEADDIDFDYITFPFDLRREVIQMGEDYRDPALGPTDIAPAYAVLEAGEQIPAAYNYEMLAELYLPPPGAVQLERRAFALAGEPYPGDGDLTGDDLDVAARNCILSTPCETCCLDNPNYPDCLLNPEPEPPGCSGGGGGSTPTGPPRRLNACGRPVPTSDRRIAGCIRVEDEGFPGADRVNVPVDGVRELVPLVDAQIYAWNGFFTIKSTQSSANGNFEIPHTWSRNFRVRIWTKWKNDRVKVHGWTPGTGSAIRLGVDHDMGAFDIGDDDVNDLAIVYLNNGDADSRGQVRYQASHALNVVARAIEFSDERGVPRPPRGLRYVISNIDEDSGAAPMLKQTGATYLIGASLSAFLSSPGALALQQLIPDVWINYGARTAVDGDIGPDAEDIPLHEMGHAVHFRRASAGAWLENVQFIIDLTARRLLDDDDQRFIAPYGDGTNAGSFWCATIEAWGEYYGASAMGDLYGRQFDEGTANNNIGSLEAFVPNARGARNAAGNADDRWIPEGLPLDLEDFASPPWEGMAASPVQPGPDVVGGLTMRNYYEAMVADRVPSPWAVRNRIIAEFLPPGQNALLIDDAFDTYGY